jgi:general nucleoside transport system permease protein
VIGIAAISITPFDANWIAATLVLTTPILLPAVGELISERAGVLNVGLEGMMVAGAFTAYLVTWKLHSLLLGVLLGMGAGTLFGVIMALLVVEAGADQVVAGIGINLMALGLTAYLFEQIFSTQTQIVIPHVGKAAIPLVSKIPQVGPALFNQDPLVYIAFLLVPAAWFLLYKTKWGLAIRASGELPAAADTAGISVRGVRWLGVLVAGALAGLGGAYLTAVSVGVFADDIPAGRGYLALIAVIFGRWRPVGVMLAALVLGGAQALQLRLTVLASVPRVFWAAVALVAFAYVVFEIVFNRERLQRSGGGIAIGVGIAGLALAWITPMISLPAQLWRSLPYLVGLIALAAATTIARMPARLAYPYRRGEG